MFGRIDIYKDTLRDKYIRVVTHTDDDGHTHETYYYYLYFDQIFGRFKKQTEVSQKVYNQTEIGKDYYIGIVHGMQSMKVYSVEQYRLTATAEHALIPDAKELERRTHWRWYAPEEQPVVNDGGVNRSAGSALRRERGSAAPIPASFAGSPSVRRRSKTAGSSAHTSARRRSSAPSPP